MNTFVCLFVNISKFGSVAIVVVAVVAVVVVAIVVCRDVR